MDTTAASSYKSRSQMARVITEQWAARQLYCCACSCDVLDAAPNNYKAVDFICGNCQAAYQLKSRSKHDENRVMDAGYNAMMEAIKTDKTPNLLVMHYSNDWQVQNLMLVPRFFFNATAIQKRNALGPTARRAGWVGCNILLSQIAADGKLRMVENGTAATPAHIRSEYEKVRPLEKQLEKLSVELRGWALDVFACVRRLNKAQFDLSEVYAFETELAILHQDNNNVKPKIRQQLQILRDAGLLEFLGRGQYRLLV